MEHAARTRQPYSIEDLAKAVTRRQASLFEHAISEVHDRLHGQYHRARVLVTGGAGFIGSQTIQLILAMEPEKVVIVDTWENGLAELVRDLRASGKVSTRTRIEPRLVDVTSPLIDRCIQEEGPFDVALAFAAAKHVRTERDAFSALQMLNTNVNGTLRALRAAARGNESCRLFMVSTDKAADPSSLMGASKRLMEEVVRYELPQVTTTRFANVAFSSGSLLESWLTRLRRGQVLPVPVQTERFFVTPSESGQLCLLASLASAGSTVVPAQRSMAPVVLTEALERVLHALDLPWTLISSDELNERLFADNKVRVLHTARDTVGEKESEIFVGVGEIQVPWLPAVDTVKSVSSGADTQGVTEWIDQAMCALEGPDVQAIIDRVRSAVPEFHHVASDKRLDDRI